MPIRLPVISPVLAASVAILVIVGSVSPTSAADKENIGLAEPEYLVSDLMRWDGLLYRDWESIPDLLSIHRPENQYAIFEKATRYDARYSAIDLAEFLELMPDEQQQRRDEARRALVRVNRFALLLQGYRLDIDEGRRPNVGSISGVKTVSQCIQALINATGLDPANPWNWHQLSYCFYLIGDAQRSRAALDNALAALERYPNDSYLEVRYRIALDYAWLDYDSGHFSDSQQWVRRAATLVPGQKEVRLLHGLNLASLGKFAEACRVARKVEYPVTRLIYSPTSFRWMYQEVSSNFVERWIQAVGHTVQGDNELATHVLRDINVNRSYPFGHRFWNDAGRIMELAGRKEDARAFYALALATRPLIEFYLYDIGAGQQCSIGNPAHGLPYFLGYGRHYLCGSRLAHAVNTALQMEQIADPMEKLSLAQRAIEYLGICRRTQQHADHALALRGMAHFMNDDFRAADRDFSQTLSNLDKKGAVTATLFLLGGVTRIQLDNARGAQSYLRRATELEPHMGLAWRTYAVAQIGANNLEAGRSSLDQAIAVDPTVPEAWFNRGLLNFQQQRIDEAIADLQQAAGMEPGNLQIAALLQHVTGIGSELAGDQQRPRSDNPPMDQEYEINTEKIALLLTHAAMDNSFSVPEYPSELLQPADVVLEDIVRVREAYLNDASPENRRLLGRALIRSDSPDLGRELLLPYWDEDDSLVDRCLILEADRALGDTARALSLVEELAGGRSQIESSYFWSLVAFVCLEQDLLDAGRLALEEAIRLDPDNSALLLQLQLIKG